MHTGSEPPVGFAEIGTVATDHPPNPGAQRAAPPTVSPPQVSLALVELELALDSVPAPTAGFEQTVAAACTAVAADLLFTLPAAGLAEGFQKIAVLRMTAGNDGALVFVLLSDDGRTVVVREPDAATADLARFAGAFVDVFQRF